MFKLKLYMFIYLFSTSKYIHTYIISNIVNYKNQYWIEIWTVIY